MAASKLDAPYRNKPEFPDYHYRLHYKVAARNPKTKTVLKDAYGNIQYKVTYGPWLNGYLNRKIDCYDATFEGKYIGTIHVRTGGTMKVVKDRFKYLNPGFPPHLIDEVEFKLTLQI